jgi:hypothetical protein
VDQKTAEKLKEAHQTWTGKLVQAQKEGNVRVDHQKAQREAAKHVERVERGIK